LYKDVIDHRAASDLVADVREELSQQPPRQPVPAAPPVLRDDSPRHDENVLEGERVDNFERRLAPAADLWTLTPPPLPPPPSASSTPRSTTQRLLPPTATPPTLRRDRRPLPGGSGGTQWWKGGLKSSSTSQRSTSAAIIVFTAVAITVWGLLASAPDFYVDLLT